MAQDEIIVRDTFTASWSLSPKLAAAVRRELAERNGLPVEPLYAGDTRVRELVEAAQEIVDRDPGRIKGTGRLRAAAEALSKDIK